MKNLLALLIYSLTCAAMLPAEIPRQVIQMAKVTTIFDAEAEFILQLGAPYHFALAAYAPLDSDSLLAEYSQPQYAIRRATKGPLSIVYSTFYGRVDGVTVTAEGFYTGLGVSVGASYEALIDAYGWPDYSTYDGGGGTIVYMHHFSAINHRGEDTYSRFDLRNGVVTMISIYIEASL